MGQRHQIYLKTEDGKGDFGKNKNKIGLHDQNLYDVFTIKMLRQYIQFQNNTNEYGKIGLSYHSKDTLKDLYSIRLEDGVHKNVHTIDKLTDKEYNDSLTYRYKYNKRESIESLVEELRYKEASNKEIFREVKNKLKEIKDNKEVLMEEFKKELELIYFNYDNNDGCTLLDIDKETQKPKYSLIFHYESYNDNPENKWKNDIAYKPMSARQYLKKYSIESFDYYIESLAKRNVSTTDYLESYYEELYLEQFKELEIIENSNSSLITQEEMKEDWGEYYGQMLEHGNENVDVEEVLNTQMEKLVEKARTILNKKEKQQFLKYFRKYQDLHIYKTDMMKKEETSVVVDSMKVMFKLAHEELEDDKFEELWEEHKNDLISKLCDFGNQISLAATNQITQEEKIVNNNTNENTNTDDDFDRLQRKIEEQKKLNDKGILTENQKEMLNNNQHHISFEEEGEKYYMVYNDDTSYMILNKNLQRLDRLDYQSEYNKGKSILKAEIESKNKQDNTPKEKVSYSQPDLFRVSLISDEEAERSSIAAKKAIEEMKEYSGQNKLEDTNKKTSSKRNKQK